MKNRRGVLKVAASAIAIYLVPGSRNCAQAAAPLLKESDVAADKVNYKSANSPFGKCMNCKKYKALSGAEQDTGLCTLLNVRVASGGGCKNFSR
jgi:hypothetical protein